MSLTAKIQRAISWTERAFALLISKVMAMVLVIRQSASCVYQYSKRGIKKYVGLSDIPKVPPTEQYSLWQTIVGPKVEYRSLITLTPSALIVIAAVYDVVGIFSLVRDIAYFWRDVTRTLWGHLFGLFGIDQFYEFSLPQFDLLTLASFAVFSILFFATPNAKDHSLPVHAWRLKARSWPIRWLGYTFVFFVGFSLLLIFWFANFSTKLSNPALMDNFYYELGLIRVLFVMALGIFAVGVIYNLKRRRKWYRGWSSLVVYLTIMPLLHMWYVAFYPDTGLMASSRSERTTANLFVVLGTLAVLLNFMRSWVTFRDILFYTVLLIATGALAEYLGLNSDQVVCSVRTFLSLPTEGYCGP